MGLTERIRKAAAKSGANKGKIIYIRDGAKLRVRFLQEIDTGEAVEFHDSFEANVCVVCQEQLGRRCAYCGDESMRTREQYVWSVWDYEAKEVKLLMYPINNTTPVAALLAMSDNYGTIMDRDYVLQCNGKQQNRTFTVMPQDPNKFRNDKAKIYTKSAVLKILDKAFPCADSSGKNIDADGNDYDEMTAPELFKLCKDRDIEVLPRQSKDYYIDRLMDSENNDEWGDEGSAGSGKYDDMKAPDLYKECKQRGIDAEQRKGAPYYIGLLEQDDKAKDEWGESDGEEADEWGDAEESEGEWEDDESQESEDDEWPS